MVHYFKQSCLLMLWALFLVNISFTSCDDKNPEVQIGELTPQKLYQTSWRGTGRCDAWVVPNMGVGMQFIDTQSGKVNCIPTPILGTTQASQRPVPRHEV